MDELLLRVLQHCMLMMFVCIRDGTPNEPKYTQLSRLQHSLLLIMPKYC